MYYIQTYKKVNNFEAKGLASFLRGDYMGSAEFEFGSVQRAYSGFADSPLVGLKKHVVQSKGGKAAEVTFYVAATPDGHEAFAESIVRHMDGTRIGKVSKENTGLWEKFNSGFPSNYSPDFWLCVDGSVDSTDKEPPIAFSDDKLLVIDFFLYFTYSKPLEERVINIFDEVVINVFDEVVISESFKGQKPEIFKVASILEDGSIVVKSKGRKFRKNPKFVYPLEVLTKVTGI